MRSGGWMKFSRLRDAALVIIGAFTVIANYTLIPEPDPTVVLAALGFLFSPLFLNRDERKK